MKRNKFETRFVCANPRNCVACMKCSDACPKNVIGRVGFLWHKHIVFKNPGACIGCKKCVKVCPQGVFYEKGSVVVKKNSFRVESLMPMAFLATLASGIFLHVAGHSISHAAWHIGALAHVLLSFLWVILTAFHFKRHFRKLKLKETPVFRRCLTIVCSIDFFVVFVTGLVLLFFIDGANSVVGLRHYVLGLLLALLTLAHIIKR